MYRTLMASAVALGLGGHSVLACNGPGQTQVDDIYPSGHAVPDNILRLYLYFTAPMGDDDILPHVTLSRSDGTPVEGVFLANRFGLWSPDRKRLTLLFDPGRVKTGLAAHDALGRALTAGESYVLTVDAGAKDADQCTLARPFSHRFVAQASDMDPPNPADWVLDIPRAGTTDPLHIDLGSPHDHLSMAFRIKVLKDGAVLPGHIRLDAAESIWSFQPSSPWSAARHGVSIGPALEDLAGNRPGQMFDHPIGLALPEPALELWFDPVAASK